MSKQAKFTAQPWAVCGGATPEFISINSPSGYIVWQMADFRNTIENGSPVFAPDYETQRANAKLIAAAPQLLEALQNTLSLLAAAYENSATGSETWRQYPKVWNEGMAAIIKATQ